MKKIKTPFRRGPRRQTEKVDAVSFLCPVCWQNLTLAVDRSAGSFQSFVYDCEVCCRPLVVTLSVEDEITADVAAE